MKNPRNFPHNIPRTMQSNSNQELPLPLLAKTSAYPNQNKKNSANSLKNMKTEELYNHLRAPMLPPSSSSRKRMENYDPSRTTDQ
jgi:hypothetical protein